MAFYIAAPTLAIATNTHATYEEGKDTFFEERGRLPNKQEQGVLVATSAASAIVEKMGAEVALGKPGKILGTKLKEVLGKRLGLTSSMAATLATSAVIEGGEEVVTELIKQVGVNQGKDKLYDSDKLYQSYVEGMAAGGMTRATLEASNLPKNVVSDILSVASGKTVKAGIDVAGKVINKVAPETVKSESSYKKSLEGGLRGAISRVESGDAGYNAYNRGQAGKTGEAKNIEGMTVGEFMAEQSAYESDKSTGIFAGGKYQIIPETMRLAAKSLGLKPEDKFDAAMQERIFQDYLVKEKRPQMYNYITGKSDDQAAAQKAMGQEWASVAYDEKGVSYYAKDSAGNKAHLSDRDADALLDTARAEYAKGIKAGLIEQEAYSKAMGAKTAATAFSYPKGSVDKRTGQFRSAGVKVYEQADVKPVTRKVVERAAKATGLTETEVTTPPIRVPESTETALALLILINSMKIQLNQLKLLQRLLWESEAIDTQKEAADSIQMLASLPDEMFNSQEGIIELTNHVGSASSALQREIQAISKMAEEGVEIPSARIEAMETMSDQIEHMRQTTVALTKEYADTPIAALDSTGRVGEAITRGSAALATIDTSGLVGDVATMVKELSAFDALVNQTAAEAPNTFKEVQGEALGTRTNAPG